MGFPLEVSDRECWTCVKITKLLQNVGCGLTFTGHISESLLQFLMFCVLNYHLEDDEYEQKIH